MTDNLFLSLLPLLILGAWAYYLSRKLEKALDQIDEYYEMITAMANELKSYGSPNIVIETE
jgi:hypothetical protein